MKVKYFRKGKTIIKVDAQGYELSREVFDSINAAKKESRRINSVEGLGSVRAMYGGML